MGASERHLRKGGEVIPALMVLAKRAKTLEGPMRPSENPTSTAMRLVTHDGLSKALEVAEARSYVHTMRALNDLPVGTLLLRLTKDARVVMEKVEGDDMVRYHDSAGWTVHWRKDLLDEAPFIILWIPEEDSHV